jgi:hypothetical protein
VHFRTLADACNPSFLQDMWIEKTGVTWEVIDFNTSHGPFISKPQTVAEKVAEVSNRFAALE